MKYYITKYAMTDGISVIDCEPPNDGDDFIIKGFSLYRIGRDAFTSPSDAIDAANKARTKKISSLKKQIAKLENLVFTIPDDADGGAA